MKLKLEYFLNEIYYFPVVIFNDYLYKSIFLSFKW